MLVQTQTRKTSAAPHHAPENATCHDAPAASEPASTPAPARTAAASRAAASQLCSRIGRTIPRCRSVARVSARERWGYAVWGSVALVIAIPEVIAAAWNKATWPTISGTIGHLEEIWSPTAIIVVAGIVVIAVQAAKAMRTDGVRTVRGPAPAPTPPQSRRAEILYGVFAFLGVLGPAVVALVLTGDTSRHTKWILGY